MQSESTDDRLDFMEERLRDLIIQACDNIKDNVDGYISCCDPSAGIEITIHIPQKYIINNNVGIEKFKFVPVIETTGEYYDGK